MPKQLPKRSCPTCYGSRVKKNGTTKAGKTRYRCLDCGASHTGTRISSSQTHTFEAFCSYVLSKHATTEDHRASRMTKYRHYSWCWDVMVPPPTQTGEVYDQVFIDGTYLHGGWVLLIACTPSHVLNWMLCTQENTVAYESLLSPIAPPLMVVTDGAKGALGAINTCWPTSKIQRCLVHVQRNNFRDLTRKPKTCAGRVLLELSRTLTRLKTQDEANAWLREFNAFYQVYGDYLKERTYAKEVPQEQRKPGRTWWYTHERDRRVYLRLKHLLNKGQLFAYLKQETPWHSTTNIVESHNATIKRLFFLHRGWSPRQQVQAAFHYLNTRCEIPQTPQQLLTQWKASGSPAYTLIPLKPRRKQHPQHGINQNAPWEDLLARAPASVEEE